MRSKIITEESSDTGSGISSKAKGADVIQLYRESQTSMTCQADNTIRDQSNLNRNVPSRSFKIRKEIGDSISHFEPIKRADIQLIDYAYDSIVDASDIEIGRIERSNLFDQWKDYLEDIIAEISNISVKHRKILGALMLVIKGKDISDFQKQHLTIFRDTTYMIRQFKITKSDTQRIISKLMTIKGNLELPLSVEGITQEDENKLTDLMKDLIERSR